MPNLEMNRMVIYAIVPVKKIGASKRRLSKSLNLQERKILTTAMLKDVLDALKTSIIGKVLVVSNDPKVRVIAKEYGTQFFSPYRKGLNCAVEEAFVWCIRNRADSVLVLPADIPLITAKDINTMVELGAGHKTVVLVPSRDCGTNAFYQCPPHIIHACFGPESFNKHFKEAKSKKVNVKIYYSLGTGLDIDSVDDLQALVRAQNNIKSKQALLNITKNRKLPIY